MSLSPLTICCGDDPLLVIEATDTVYRQALEAGYDERIRLIAGSAGFHWDRIFAETAMGSFFSTKKLIEIRIPNGKPGSEGAKALQRYCNALPAETVTVIALPALGWQERKAGWFKTITAVGRLIDAKAPNRDQLPQWLSERLKRQGQSTDSRSLHWFADQVEGNLMAANQELLKLALLYRPGSLSFDDISEALSNSARYRSDQLSDALLLHENCRYWQVLEGLIEEGEPLPRLLWRLAEDSRTLIKLLEAIATGQSTDAAFKSAKLFYDRRTQFQRYLSIADKKNLSSALAQYGLVDKQLKGIAKGDPWETLRRLPLTLAANPS